MNANAKTSLLSGLQQAAQAAPQRQNQTPAMPVLHIENQGLKAKIKELEQSTSGTFKLKPSQVVIRPWTNRSADSFRIKDFAELREKIEAHGGNYIPIVVQKINGVWHLICGRRRMQACKELGLEVLAVELKGDVSDLEIFAMMHGENQDRTKPSLYEIGLSIEEFLKEQQAKTGKSEEEIVSLRDLEKIVGLSHTSVRMARALVAMPDDLLLCFESLIDFSVGNVQTLLNALEKDGEAVKARAKAVIEANQQLPVAKGILALCFEGGIDGSEPEKPLHATKEHKPFGRVKKDAKGGYTLSFVPGFKRDHIEQLKQLAIELAKGNEKLLEALKPKAKAKPAKKPTAAKKKAAKAKAPAKRKAAPQATQQDTQQEPQA